MNLLEIFKTVCARYLIIENTEYIDVIFAAFFANRLDSKPVWLYLIGPPGSGKTEIVQALGGTFAPDGHYIIEDSKDIIMRDSITVNALVSGYKSEDGGEPSLLPKLDGKVLVLKDFTLMLKMRREILHEILGQLRAAYDGSLSRNLGNYTKSFVSKFGVIACVTNEIDQHRGLLASLGERFLSYRMPPITDHEKYRRGMKAASGRKVKQQEYELAHAAHDLINSQPQIATITKDHIRSIVKIAQVVAKARTEVRRDRVTKEPDLPEPEVPTRLPKQLTDLCIGLAMARQKKHVTSDEVLLIQRIALHSISPKRHLLFRAMLKHYPEWIERSELSEEMKFNDRVLHIWLSDLYLLDLVERKQRVRSAGGNRTTTYHVWRLKDGRTLKRVLAIED